MVLREETVPRVIQAFLLSAQDTILLRNTAGGSPLTTCSLIFVVY